MTFDFTIRAGSTQVNFDLGDISRRDWTPRASGYGFLDVTVTVTAGSSTVAQQVEFEIGLFSALAEWLRTMPRDYAGEFTFDTYQPGFELVMTFRPERLFDIKGHLQSTTYGDPQFMFDFDSNFGSPYYRETLDELDDILCILDPKA